MADLGLVYDTTTGKWTAKKLEGGQIADNAISAPKLAANAVVSGKVADGAIVSGSIAALSIGAGHIATNAVVSGKVAGGAIVSGSIASGQIGSNHLASGIVVDAAKYNAETRYKAGDAIEAFAGASLQSGVDGWVVQADAFDPSLMPAIGIVTTALASGDPAEIFFDGVCDMASGVISGMAGSAVFVASGGLITTTPPSTSGSIQQKMGEVLGSGKIFVMSNPDTVVIGG